MLQPVVMIDKDTESWKLKDTYEMEGVNLSLPAHLSTMNFSTVKKREEKACPTPDLKVQMKTASNCW